MTTPPTPKEIGSILRKHRKQQGMTGSELGEKAKLSQSKISKLESGIHSRDDLQNIQKIANILKIDSLITQQFNEALTSEWAQNIKVYDTFASHVDKEELTAKIVRIYCNCLVPALLQTTAYQTALHTINGSKDLLNTLRVTNKRQTRMWEGQAQYHFVMTEAALYSSFAKPAIHLAQLMDLRRFAHMPTITVGIIPTTAGMPTLDVGNFGIFDDRTLCDALMHREIMTTNSYNISVYIKTFIELQNLAVYNEEAIALIDDAADTFR